MDQVSPTEIPLQDQVERLQTRVAALERQLLDQAAILEKAPVMISIVRAPDFVYEFVNPAFQALAPGKAFIGRRFADVWSEVSEPLVEILRNVIQTCQPFRLEDSPYTILRGTGEVPEVVYVTYSWIPLFGPDGKADRVFTLAYETTETVRLRQAEKALRESEERLRVTLDSAGLGTWTVDPLTGEFAASATARQIHGLAPDTAVDHKVAFAVVHPEDRAEVRDGMRQAIEEGTPFHSEHRILWPDGSERWMLSQGRFLAEPAGASPRMFGVVKDITARKRAEAALRDNETLLRTLSDNLPEAAIYRYVQDVNGTPRFEFISAGIERLAGLSPAEVVSDATLMARYVAPEDLCRLNAAIALSRDRLTPVEEEVRHTHPVTGELRWALLRSIPSRRQDGSTAWDGIQFDITARKRTEEALRESRAVLEAALASMADAVFVSDARGRFTDFNDAFATFHKFTGKDECLKTLADYPDILEMFLPDGTLAPLDMWALPRALRGETAAHAEYTLRRKDTGESWIGSYNFGPIRDNAGVITGAVVTAHDITARKRREEALRKSEERFRAIFQNGQIGIALGDMDGRLEMVNPVFRKMLGYEEKELIGKNFREITLDEHLPAENLYVAEMLEGKRERYDIEKRYIRKDGKAIWVAVYATFLKDSAGKPQFGMAMVQDINERKRAEESSRESEAVLRSFFDSAGMMRGILEIVDGRLAYVSCNAATAALLGVDRDSIPGRRVTELGTSEERERWWSGLCETSRRTGQPITQEYARKGADGQEHWLLATVTCLGTGRSGNPRFGYTMLDVTERKRAEEAREQTNALLEGILDSIPEPVWVMDAGGQLVRSNRVFEGRHLSTVPGALGEYFPVIDVFTEDGHPVPPEMWPVSRALRGERISGLTLRLTFRSGGPTRFYRYSASPIYDRNGRVAQAVVVLFDVTENRIVEEALRNSRKQIQDIIDGSPGVVFVKDLEGRFLTANQAFERFLGVTSEELRGKTDYDLITRVRADYYRENDRRVAETGEPIQVEELADLADGRRHVLLANKFPLRDAAGKIYAVCAIPTDITERKQAEERLRQSQKLESLGLLAGGVAHDFNNLLVGVIGNTSLLQEILPPDHPAADLLGKVLKSGEQAAQLTRQMLAYSGKGNFEIEPLDLSSMIPDIIDLVRSSIPKKVELRLDLVQGLPAVEADRGQIQQVFMNLAINAAEAIGSHEGLITIRTGVRDVDQPNIEFSPELPSGKYVYLEVRDTGCGMDEATRARICDPFFSTKFVGRGLGLAAVSGILRGHKGGMTVSSAPGKGSCFTVLFPASTRQTRKVTPPARDTSLRGAGTVLVVDDEGLVLEMARVSLQRCGYNVLTANSGLAAIDVFKKHSGEIALVVLDLSMPRMSGSEALPELRKIRPEVKVLVSSGYRESETIAMFGGQQVSGFISKPYTAEGIAAKVKACLG